jgi:hypothetical protein
MRLQPVLQHLSLGSVASYENLTFAPILGPDAVSTEFLLPDEALQTGYFTVTESGDVETLLVDNRLDVPVFVPAGATFEGETQNRAARFAVIVAPRSGQVPLLVRCIEEGQPLVAATRFLGSEGILLPSARTGDVEQYTVWGTISHTIGQHNRTFDYSYGLRATDVTAYLDAVGREMSSQRGYVAAVRDEGSVSFYADVLGSQRLYARLHEKLWRGVAATARAAGRKCSSAKFTTSGRSDLLAFLRDAGQANVEPRRLRTGLLGTVCVGGGSVDVSALLDSGIPIQVSFRREPPGPPHLHVDGTVYRMLME